MMRALAVAAAIVLAAPGTGVLAAGVAAQGSGGQAEGDNIVAAFFDQFYARDFGGALRSADKLTPLAAHAEGRAIVSSLRAAALLGLKRKAEALKLFAEADRLSPQNEMITGLQFDAGLIVNDMEVAADALDRMIARFPDEVRKLEPRGVYWLLRNENKTEAKRNEDRRVALARLGFGGEAAGDDFAREAVKILLQRGDLAGATELLRYIDEPQIVEDMLIQRRYQPLWPELEQRAGPRLEKVRAASVGVAEREYAEHGDSKRLQYLANALRHAGRHAEAIALRAKLPPTPAAWAEADEETGWAVNNIALALDEVGRGDEADQLFALLNEARMEDGGWRVSMIINRLELLVNEGKYDRAAQLLGPTEESARNDGNPYAQQLVRRLRYCTLAGLSRREEAAKLLPEVLKHAKDARHATIDALLCAGDHDKAESILLEGLDDDHFSGQLVRSLQPRPLTSDDPSIWAGRWQELRKRPQVAAAFSRLGRDMPEPLVVPSPRKTASKD